MKTEIKKITPAIAEDLLKKNLMNRRLNEKLVSDYSRMMSAGLWKEETGESIKIAFDGTILDGQYRLNAIIKSNCSISFLIISELEKDIFSVLDTGKKRSASDIFYISGVKNATNVAAGIRRYFILKSGRTGFGNNASIKNTSSSELLSIYNSKQQLWDSIYKNVETWYHHSQRILTQSELFGLYAYFYDIDNTDAFKFMDLLSNGVNLDNNNPIKQLREKLIFSKTNTKFSMVSEHRTALIFKAWNLFRKKENVRFLKFTLETDNFPKPI